MLTRTQSRIEPTIAVGVNPVHPLARGLGACWLLNEGAGGMVHDASGHHHDGAFSGNPMWSQGRFGRAVEFDGADDWITMGDCLDLGRDDITVLALVNYGAAAQPDSWSGNHYGAIAGKGYLNPSKGYGLMVDPDNKVSWQVRNLSSSIAVESNAALNDGAWHLAIGVCDRDDPSGLRLYIDGVPQNATADATAFDGIDLSESWAFAIGARQESSTGTWFWDFLGSIAMVCVWKRVLAEAEIRALQQNPFEMFAWPGSSAMLTPAASAVVECAGSIEAVASTSASARVIRNISGTISTSASLSGTLTTTDVVSLSGTASACSALHGTLSTFSEWPTPADTFQGDTDWRKEALLSGATNTAFQLGTVLTQGWFWVRRNGCTALYRGPDLTRVDLSRILYVAEPSIHEIVLSAGLSHEPGSTYCYLVRRFNSCGRQERTCSAAVLLRLGTDGQPALPRPNGIFGLSGKQIDPTSMRLSWFYSPLDQEVAPAQFNVYRSDPAGSMSLLTQIGTVPYRGRRFYCFDAKGLTGERHTFSVRAVSVDGAESAASAGITRRIMTLSPEAALILSANAV